MSNIVVCTASSQAAAHAIASFVLMQGEPQISLTRHQVVGGYGVFVEFMGAQSVRTTHDLERRMQALWAAALVSRPSGTYPYIYLKAIRDLAQQHAALNYAGSSVDDIDKAVEAVMFEAKTLVESLVQRHAAAIEDLSKMIVEQGAVTAEELLQFMHTHNIRRSGA